VHDELAAVVTLHEALDVGQFTHAELVGGALAQLGYEVVDLLLGQWLAAAAIPREEQDIERRERQPDGDHGKSHGCGASQFDQ